MDQSKTAFPPKLVKPALRALSGAGLTHLEQLTEISESDLMKLHGMGPKAMQQISDALKENGLSFKID
jgi:DNA-directed RNA polymerase alpha subunit